LVGDAGVGKTYLLNKYIRGTTPKNPASTIGVEFATRTVELKEGGKVKAQIWDTAGQERYRSITSAYIQKLNILKIKNIKIDFSHYRRALGAILVYDITNEKTFDNLRKWMEDVKYLSETDITLMLVGNKFDRVENDPSLRRVRKEDAKNFAKDYDLLFLETSAINGMNVANCFEELLQCIFMPNFI